VRHKNFIGSILSMLQMDILSGNDTVIQMARCSFDMHMQEFVGTLISGASVIMLHPYGTLDLSYLVKVLIEKQVSYMETVPSYLSLLCDYVNTHYGDHFLNNLRSLCSCGKYFSIHCHCRLKRCKYDFL
jgi:acyl-coenzyme A synthetase/AMP-(fatty) acid ligase